MIVQARTFVATASGEEIQRFFRRYRFAHHYCEGKDVLEVAYGAGYGQGSLAKKARKMVADSPDYKVLFAAACLKGKRKNVG